MLKLTSLAAALLCATTALAQVVIPPHSTVYNGYTRGYNFVAQTNFNIIQLELPLDAQQAGDTASFAVRVNNTMAFFSAGTPGPSVACNVPVIIGDLVDVVGNWSPAAPGAFTAHNSYGNSAPFATNIEGVPHTLYRQGVQNDIGNPAWVQGNQFLYTAATTAGSIGRVIMYTSQGQTGTVFASSTSVGTGCVRKFASFYENASTFDLSNTSLSLQFLGTSYLALPGATSIAPQTSAPVVMGDDVVVTFPLGWTFPYAGGTTTDLYVSSNGFIHLGVNAANGCCAFNPTLFFNGGSACIAAKWRDLNPSAGGTVQFDTDPANGVAYITFTGVPDYGSTANLNDFQYVLSANGNVELRFGTCAATAGATGYSPGLNNLDPGSIDISATPLIVTDSVDVRPLALGTGSLRPIQNTQVTLTTSNLAPTTLFGAIILGYINPSLDLTGLGMAGCTQYSDGLVTLLYLPGGAATAATNLNVPAALGFHLFAQSVAYDPASALTGLGAIASNGVDMLIGDW